MNEALQQFLTELPERHYTSSIIFEKEVIPSLVDILGYDTDDVHYQVSTDAVDTLDRTLHTDAIISRDADVRPWLVIEVKYLDQLFRDVGSLPEKYEERVSLRTKSHGAEYGVLLSNFHLIITDGNTHQTFYLKNLDEEDVEEIGELLEPPETLPREKVPSDTEPRPDRINTRNFELDLSDFQTALEAAESASSPADKGDTFERLSALLFEGIPFVSIRHTNLRTATSELDLVVEYEGANSPTIFDDFNRFIPVECKNWQTSVGSSELRDFKGKMDAANVDLGILLSKSGISGDKGSDAVREKKQTFNDSAMAILVVDNADLNRILRGTSFYRILDEKLFQLRFDV